MNTRTSYVVLAVIAAVMITSTSEAFAGGRRRRPLAPGPRHRRRGDRHTAGLLRAGDRGERRAAAALPGHPRASDARP